MTASGSVLEIPPIFDDPPKWSAPGGTKIAMRDRRAQSTSNWLSIAWHCGNRYINLLIEATPRPHVGCRRRNLLIEIGDGRPYIEAPVSHLRRGTKVNYCADTVSFHQHVVRENIEVHQGRRQAAGTTSGSAITSSAKGALMCRTLRSLSMRYILWPMLHPSPSRSFAVNQARSALLCSSGDEWSNASSPE